ncbi:MAG TPA: Crp/Fnr family transcriptional regulator [Sphingobium sp.]|nr:Crp/Fnr family transcriptional regulator [Sphingobium sp.]
MPLSELIFENDLLAMLDPESRTRLAIMGSLITWSAGTVLFEPDDLMDAVLFPLGGSLATLIVTVSGNVSAEAALIGRNGMVSRYVGDRPVPAFARITVAQGGRFLRIALSDFTAAERLSPAITDIAARFAECLTAQLLQSAACNAVHSLEQRTARWLLAAADHTGSQYISVTQEQLGALLGAGRSYTSRQIQRFKAERLVRTRRGGIVIVDYDGMATHACACHEHIQRHVATMLHEHVQPSRPIAGAQTDQSLRDAG